VSLSIGDIFSVGMLNTPLGPSGAFDNVDSNRVYQ